jgi:integrase
MALRKFGKIYHILYRDLSGKVRTVTTGESDKKEALKKENAWMSTLKAERMKRKRGLHFTVPGAVPLADEALRAMEGNGKRVKIVDAITLMERNYVDSVPINTRKAWKRFSEDIMVKYLDEVTPQLAFDYMDKYYGSRSGKTFNNNKNALNTVFKTLLLEAGLDKSPFELVKNRKNRSLHQRPFAEEEFLKIFNTAEEPWKSACLIAWYTGFRRETVFNLRHENIKDDVITVMPGKTARFGRAVCVPLHPHLKEYISRLPPSLDGRVLGFDKRKTSGGHFNRYFGKLLKHLNIDDNDDGIVCFNSIRNSFITRCREAGLKDHAIRGIVGHTNSNMTDLYSRDIQSAMPVKELPRLGTTPKSM